jgi:hypothetical protein
MEFRRDRCRALVLAVWATFAAAAAEPAVAPELTALGWELFGFDGKTSNRYRLAEDGAIEVMSASWASLLYRAVAPDLARTPCLAWRWRVDRAMVPTDLTRLGGDDRPVAVYVLFPYDAGEASLGERLRRILVELVQGSDAPGRVLVYVWGGLNPRGMTHESPYLGSAGALIVQRAGDAPLGQWFTEEVDVAKDYVRVFKQPARTPSEVAVGADSDDTRSTSLARVADLRFQPCGAGMR